MSHLVGYLQRCTSLWRQFPHACLGPLQLTIQFIWLMLKANSVYDHLFPLFWLLKFQVLLSINFHRRFGTAMCLYLQGLCITSWTSQVLKMEAIRQTWIHNNDPENRSKEHLWVTATLYRLTKHSFPPKTNVNQEYCQTFTHLVMNRVCWRVPTQKKKTSTKKMQILIHISSEIRNFDHSSRAVEHYINQAVRPRHQHMSISLLHLNYNPYPTAFPYGNGMVLHFYQQQESSTTKTVHKVINKGFKTYV